MKKLLILFLLITPAYAQQQQKTPMQQKLETTIGSLIVENTSLSIQIEQLQKENADLKKQLEDHKKDSK